jgi:hypothetical protein
LSSLLCIILLALLSGILIFLMIPVSLGFDSVQKCLTVRWLRFSVTKRLGEEKPRGLKEKPKRKKKRVVKAIGRLLLRDRYLFLKLLHEGYRSVIDILRSVSIRELEANLSTPDPMWNGVLWGVFANIHFENVTLATNFQNINYVRGRLQFYPYRIVRVAAGLLVRLPYRRIIRTALTIKKY